MKTLEELVQELPPDLKEEVRQYAQTLLDATMPPPGRRLRLDWVGGLREYRGQYTARELKKKALEWRED